MWHTTFLDWLKVKYQSRKVDQKTPILDLYHHGTQKTVQFWTCIFTMSNSNVWTVICLINLSIWLRYKNLSLLSSINFLFVLDGAFISSLAPMRNLQRSRYLWSNKVYLGMPAIKYKPNSQIRMIWPIWTRIKLWIGCPGSGIMISWLIA